MTYRVRDDGCSAQREMECIMRGDMGALKILTDELADARMRRQTMMLEIQEHLTERGC